VPAPVEYVDCVTGFHAQHIHRVVRLFGAQRRLLKVRQKEAVHELPAAEEAFGFFEEGFALGVGFVVGELSEFFELFPEWPG